jgi:hypothetical protein
MGRTSPLKGVCMRRRCTPKLFLALSVGLAAILSASAASAAGSCDGIGDGIWNGCRGNGCSVCQEKLAGYDCYFQNHPDCVLNTTCAGQFYSCDAACPPPSESDRCTTTCQTDTCTSCGRPAGGDADFDGVPDQLEYDLAHKYFPTILLQGFDDDLEESYLYYGKAIPFTVQALSPRSICDEGYECLEIRYGTAYFHDTGDTIFGISSHLGDSEFYAVLVQRTSPWTYAQGSADSWQVIRDFTAAHWRDRGDSSRYAAYGTCSPYCRGYDQNETACQANSSYCSWFGGFCSGGSGDDHMPCSYNYDEGSCYFAGGSCHWLPSQCSPTTSLPVCQTTSPVTTYRTLYSSEGKHGLYHSKSECDSGGYLSADACPYNQYDMRWYKGQLLQNVGSATNHVNFDTTIQYPDKCGLYDVWGGTKFGGSSAYSEHFTYNLTWALP